MFRISLCICVVALLSAGMVHAQETGLGIGISLGEPTGLAVKNWLSARTAVAGAAAWSFAHEGALHLNLDYLIHHWGAIKVREGKMPLYTGIGGRLKLKDESQVGIRIPFGLSYLFADAPLDISWEIVPVLDILPGTDFRLNGALTIRYFF